MSNPRVTPVRTVSPVQPPVTRLFTSLYVVASGTLFLAMITPVAVTLALKTERIAPATKESSLGLILGVGALIALLSNPVVGLLSDRTTARLGMRRPWLIGGAIASLLGATAIGMASSVLVVLVAWCVTQVALCCILVGLNAILPDQYPANRRGRVSGMVTFAQAISTPIGLGIAQVLHRSMVLAFAVPALVGAVPTLVLVVVLKDRRIGPENRVRGMTDLRRLLRSFAINPRRHPDYAWAWLGRLLIMLAFSFSTIYAAYFLTDHFGIDDDVVAGKVAISSFVGALAIAASSIVAGHLSDRLGRRKVFVASASVVFGLAVLTYPFLSGFGGYVLAYGVASLGIGIYLAVDLALVADVLPDQEADAGKDLAIFSVANRLPDSLAPLLAPLLLAIGGGDDYTVLFSVAAVIGLLGAMSVRPIKGVR
jgi:MFS family permease